MRLTEEKLAEIDKRSSREVARRKRSDFNKIKRRKRKIVWARIRKILGCNLVNGRYYRHGLGLEKDLRYG